MTAVRVRSRGAAVEAVLSSPVRTVLVALLLVAVPVGAGRERARPAHGLPRPHPHAAWKREAGERVLIVEDDRNDADLAMTICSEAGVRCEVVGTVADAVASIGRVLPRAAVVDLVPPHGSGKEVLRALRAAAATVRVIFVTAQVDGVPSRSGDEQFTKPIDAQRLRAWLLAATAASVPA